MKNKNILMVLAPVGFQDLEYGQPREEFEKAGFNIKIASLQNGIAQGAFGAQVKIDLLATEVNTDDFDAVVFVGGGGMIELVDREELKKLARDFAQNNKLTAAICIAPMILANAGLLHGRQGTVHVSAKDDFINKGANYTGEDVTINNNIITASGPPAAKEFGQKIIEWLKNN